MTHTRTRLQTGEYVCGDGQLENELQDCMNPDTFIKKPNKY
jgi:hypothetical protein